MFAIKGWHISLICANVANIRRIEHAVMIYQQWFYLKIILCIDWLSIWIVQKYLFEKEVIWFPVMFRVSDLYFQSFFLVNLSRRLQCNYCDHVLSIVRSSSRRRNFSQWNGIQRNLIESKISKSSAKFVAAVASDWLIHFQLLLWKYWTILNKSRQKATSQCSLPSVFFGSIGKTRWLPWPLIGWDIFDFSSVTTEWNLTKLDWKQEPNAFYHVCVFGPIEITKISALASDWLRADRKKQEGRPGLWITETFSTSPLKPLNGIQRNLKGSKISMLSTKFLFFMPIGKTR